MSDGIVYQNKDIEFKLLSETYKEKSFEAYGQSVPSGGRDTCSSRL